MDRFREIEAFVAVVEAGSFVRAGESLRISKAAVSRSLLDLEQRLGVRLLQRTTRRLSLTDAGRAYFDRGKQLLADLAEADNLVGSDSMRPVGLLKISAPQTFGMRVLADAWGVFLDRYPEVKLEVFLTDREVDMIDEGYDASIRIARTPDSSLISRQLCSMRMHLVASPDYLARKGTPTSVADLELHDTIAFTRASRGASWRLLDGADEIDVPIKPRIQANDGDTCVAAALNHQGIAYQPDFIVGAHLEAGRLVRVLPELDGYDLGAYAAYPARKHLSVKVRVLIDFLAEHFSTPRW
ncbi:MAG: LysR family transcriptional regulator [Burkholderiaceae bacterium]